MANTRRIGHKYEDRAAAFLIEHGFKIRDRNFFSRGGEIDIIASEGSTIVFVEVRYRGTKAGGVGTALESVDPHKQLRICRTATRYLQKYNLFAVEDFRFDVIAIGAGGDIEHIRNAFEYRI